MKRGQQIVNLLPFFVELSTPKTKAKPSGLPDSNFIFFVATKKTMQKKTWRCAWHVWLDIAVTSIQYVVCQQSEGADVSWLPRIVI
jgi:hypothetical protein